MGPAVTALPHLYTVTAGTGELGTGAGAQTEDGLVGGAETAGLGRTRSVVLYFCNTSWGQGNTLESL